MIEIRHRSIANGLSIRDAYDALYQERCLVMPDSFYLWLLHLVDAQKGQLLIDVACGNGRLVQLARARGIHAIGLDLSIQGIAKAANSRELGYWIVADGQKLPIENYCADIVMSIGSLEHYANPLEGVSQITKLVKPQGIVCVLLPNAYGMLGNILSVLRTGEVFDDRQPLQRYATRRTWEAMLRKGGLCIDRVVPFNEFVLPRTPIDLFQSIRRPQKYIKGLISRITPLNLTNHFVFLCHPASHFSESFYPMLAY